jgi:hypothetical protein
MAIVGKNEMLCQELTESYYRLADDLMIHGLDGEKVAEMAVTMSRCAVGQKKEAATLDFAGRADIATETHEVLLRTQLASYQLLEQWHVNSGKDPAPSLQPALELIANEQRSNPRNVVAHQYQGIYQLLIAKFQQASGQDASAAIALAQEQFDEAQRLAPSIVTQRYLTELSLLRVEGMLARVEDAQAALNDSAEMIRECLKAFQYEGECVVAEMRHALFSARATAAKGGNEREWLEIAIQKAIQFATVANSERGGWEIQFAFNAYEIAAEATRRLVAIARPDERRKHIAAGVATCEKAFAINPNDPRLLLACGGIRLLEAAGLAGQTRIDTAKKSMALLERAATLNPLLRRDVDPLVAAAKQLGTGF